MVEIMKINEWVETLIPVLTMRGYDVKFDIGDGVNGTLYISRYEVPPDGERLILVNVPVDAEQRPPPAAFFTETVLPTFAANDAKLATLRPEQRQKTTQLATRELMIALSSMIGDENKQAYEEEISAVVKALDRYINARVAQILRDEK